MPFIHLTTAVEYTLLLKYKKIHILYTADHSLGMFSGIHWTLNISGCVILKKKPSRLYVAKVHSRGAHFKCPDEISEQVDW